MKSTASHKGNNQEDKQVSGTPECRASPVPPTTLPQHNDAKKDLSEEITARWKSSNKESKLRKGDLTVTKQRLEVKQTPVTKWFKRMSEEQPQKKPDGKAKSAEELLNQESIGEEKQTSAGLEDRANPVTQTSLQQGKAPAQERMSDIQLTYSREQKAPSTVRSFELTGKELHHLQEVMRKKKGAEEEVMANHSIKITREDMSTMREGRWFNTAIVDVYMQLIEKRSLNCSSLPKVKVISVFFYLKLMESEDKKHMERWVGDSLTMKDMVIFPILWSDHYSLIIFQVDSGVINYLDSSLHSRHHSNIPYNMKNFLEQYFKRRNIRKLVSVRKIEDIPHQNNGNDCGPFICMYGERATREEEANFSQKDINYLRMKMASDILQGEIQTDVREKQMESVRRPSLYGNRLGRWSFARKQPAQKVEQVLTEQSTRKVPLNTNNNVTSHQSYQKDIGSLRGESSQSDQPVRKEPTAEGRKCDPVDRNKSKLTTPHTSTKGKGKSSESARNELADDPVDRNKSKLTTPHTSTKGKGKSSESARNELADEERKQNCQANYDIFDRSTWKEKSKPRRGKKSKAQPDKGMQKKKRSEENAGNKIGSEEVKKKINWPRDQDEWTKLDVDLTMRLQNVGGAPENRAEVHPRLIYQFCLERRRRKVKSKRLGHRGKARGKRKSEKKLNS